MSDFATQWGLIKSLKECKGKTIEAVEEIDGSGMGQSFVVVGFTDGTRALFPGHQRYDFFGFRGADIEDSKILTPHEKADVKQAAIDAKERRRREEEQSERRQLQDLREKYPE